MADINSLTMQFKRDEFETRDEFLSRVVTAFNEFGESTAYLELHEYDIDEFAYKMSFKWRDGLPFSIFNYPLILKINCDRGLARLLFAEHMQHPRSWHAIVRLEYNVGNEQKKVFPISEELFDGLSIVGLSILIQGQWFALNINDAENHEESYASLQFEEPEALRSLLNEFQADIDTRLKEIECSPPMSNYSSIDGVWQTADEFLARAEKCTLNNAAGVAFFKKENYNLDRQQWDFRVDWKEWMKDFVIEVYWEHFTLVDITRDQARSMHLEGEEWPL